MVKTASLGAEERMVLSEVFAFLGNSLLAPMNQTATVGLDPEFWAGFPCFGSSEAEEACGRLEEFARNAAQTEDAVTQVSVEFTQLFVGPPKPAAFPWESYYVAPDVTSGFGEPTYQMQRLLRENGLAVSHESNNQLADHIGIELLLLSEMHRRAAEGHLELDAVEAFAAEHPGKWIGALCAAAEEAAPGGYIPAQIALAQALLAL